MSDITNFTGQDLGENIHLHLLPWCLALSWGNSTPWQITNAGSFCFSTLGTYFNCCEVPQWWFATLLKAHVARLVDSSTRYRTWFCVDMEVVFWCKEQGPVLTTTVWKAWHTGPTIHHRWALIWVFCSAKKATRTSCNLLLLDRFRQYVGYTLAQIVFPMSCWRSLTVLSETWKG